MSKLNSFEISTHSAQKSERKNILNAKIVKNATSSLAKRQTLSTAQYLLTLNMQLHSAMLAKSWNFF